MRVISGKHRGRKIETVSDKNLRPTMGIAREAVFNILSHGQFAGENRLLDGCVVLDLFCGCGALSIEALSRGASKAILIDIDQQHLDIARQNLKTIGEVENAVFLRADSSNPPPARQECNLVFIDPPYKKDLVEPCLRSLERGRWLADGAIIVLETEKKEEPKIPDGIEELSNRNYGNSRIRILKWHKNGQ